MRHGFFGDMGGMHLVCPHFPPFPIDGHRLVYPVKEHLLEYPEISERAIWDRNEADTAARAHPNTNHMIHNPGR